MSCCAWPLRHWRALVDQHHCRRDLLMCVVGARAPTIGAAGGQARQAYCRAHHGKGCTAQAGRVHAAAARSATILGSRGLGRGGRGHVPTAAVTLTPLFEGIQSNAAATDVTDAAERVVPFIPTSPFPFPFTPSLVPNGRAPCGHARQWRQPHTHTSLHGNRHAPPFPQSPRCAFGPAHQAAAQTARVRPSRVWRGRWIAGTAVQHR